MFLRMVHSWGLDTRLDELLHAHLRISSPGPAKLLDRNISFGFLSNHGFITMSMPGYDGKWVREDNKPEQQHLRLYFMSPILTTNLSLALVSICEALTNLSAETVPLLLGSSQDENEESQQQKLDSHSRSNELFRELISTLSVKCYSGEVTASSASPVIVLVSKTVSLFPAFNNCESPLREAQIAIIYAMHQCTRQLHWLNAGGPKDPCPVVFYRLLCKWQDPCLQIRYAARSLLCSILDNIDAEGRKSLLDWWIAQLPPMIYSKKSHPQNPTSNGVPDSKATPSMIKGTSDVYDVKVSSSREGSAVPVDTAKAVKALHLPLPAETGVGSRDADESFSFSALHVNMDRASLVQECAWWVSHKGYNQSEKDQLSNHTTAIVLLAMLYSRYSQTNYRNLDPLVYVRDLVEKQAPLKPQNNPSLKLKGLCEPHYAPLKSDPQDADLMSHVTIPDHEVARCLCDCLMKLLLNQPPRLAPQEFGLSEAELAGAEGSPAGAVQYANILARLLWSLRGADGTHGCSTLRRIALDMIGRGFCVWEPYLDVAHVLMTILVIGAEAEASIKNAIPGETLSDYCDLKRTARQALWNIGFAQPQLVTLTLSREVRFISHSLV
ncbi:hypothetical protein Ciccas_010763 [Cichlidogyrus casuarinus]|uniref:Uncharacterized protein n=1 Tax=Cichlidogyrus casuarinus TaxID=1844966 RepID=A0ABD2PT59_9PLAT